MFRNVLLKLNQHNTTIIQNTLRNACASPASTQRPKATNAYPTHPDTILEQAQIEEATRITPALVNAPLEVWHRSHEVFLNHGLPTISFLRIVTGNPAVILRPPQRIIQSLEIWRSCQFGEKLFHLLITKYPELLDVNDQHKLLNHIAYLKTFATTNKNVWKLLMNCPDLLEQSEQRIEEKIQYLTKVMRIEIPEIVKSEALSKPLSEIRCRHVFLERLGLFTPRPLKADPNEPSKNHRLYQITDTSEKTFATKICRVSLIEFETFKELYAKELKRKKDEEDFSDEEDSIC